MTPYLCLESDVDFADVVQGGEYAEPGDGGWVEIVPTTAAGHAPADGRLRQQRFEAGADVCHVVLQQVDALRIVTVRFRPEGPDISKYYRVLPRERLHLQPNHLLVILTVRRCWPVGADQASNSGGTHGPPQQQL